MSNHIDTICVQGGYRPGNGEPRQVPIIQSTTFKYDTSEDMGKLFDLEAEGYFYSRLQNPTCDHAAAKICEMEGGAAAMLTSAPRRSWRPPSGPTPRRCSARPSPIPPSPCWILRSSPPPPTATGCP